MRIVFLCTDAYGGHGGIALFNREFIAALLRHPLCEEITVIPRIVPNAPGEIPPRVRFIENAAGGRFAYLRAIVAARRSRPDLVICGHVNLLPVAFGVGPRPLLVIYGIDAWQPLRDPFSRRLVHHCRGVVSISALTRDRFVAWSGYRGPTFLLPNAVHPEQYGIRPKRADLVDHYRLRGKRVLLTVGRLAAEERYKGIDEVMEVMPDLPADVVYLIAGGGNDFPRLQKKSVGLGIGDRVRFTGLFPDADKTDLYNLADVYVMPSRGEGFGFVFLEAMASGVPVIGSRLDGGREALRDGALGALVDPADRGELRAAIETELANGHRVIPEGLDWFSFERFVERVREIIDSVT